MTGRLFDEAADAAASAPPLQVSVVVRDRGPEPEWHTDRRLYGPWWRFEAEVVGYAAVRELGMSPWEAVHRVIANHRTLLERRWSA